MKHVSIRVYGRVQGVFFRASTKEMAEQLGIHGSVRNVRDGSVAIEAEGDEEAIEKFIKWCQNGPELAMVDRLDVTEKEMESINGFSIER
jgi:acylphosphatase